MPTHDIIAIGASAGGVQPLSLLAGGLRKDFPAALLVVFHFPPDVPSVLPHILTKVGPLPACHAMDGQALKPGNIFLAPPDRHMLVEDGRIRVRFGPAENRHRPSIDVLFRSVAEVHGPRSVGVILSGMLDDGVAGLIEIRRRGGLTIVQEPASAAFPSMPEKALAALGPNYCLTPPDIATVLNRVASNGYLLGDPS